MGQWSESIISFSSGLQTRAASTHRAKKPTPDPLQTWSSDWAGWPLDTSASYRFVNYWRPFIGVLCLILYEFMRKEIYWHFSTYWYDLLQWVSTESCKDAVHVESSTLGEKKKREKKTSFKFRKTVLCSRFADALEISHIGSISAPTQSIKFLFSLPQFGICWSLRLNNNGHDQLLLFFFCVCFLLLNRVLVDLGNVS